MVSCWKETGNCVEDEQCTGGTSNSVSGAHFPHKAFWVSLSASLLLLLIGLGLTGHFGLLKPHSQVCQIVRLSAPDQTGFLINQSAVVDQQNHLVTFTVTSAANQTSTVLFDIKHGLICYRPEEQNSCFLQKMQQFDYDNIQSLLQKKAHQSYYQLTGNETQWKTQFLGVPADSRVDMSTLDKPLQGLCNNSSVHWTKMAHGPGKQRLVYFCIDVCFPSNICVSVCFYYLPE
ncbi:BRICHOS domain-containing protein 5 [Cynoglossus semilaevis]|uniref:BRICHOS domain-containing protein 5 n=1 Tax=Cynoglossus semilaevis TaxID=244447 RepID=UPI000D62BF7E|nr:BRICHOS domain-containing protein 5 [Cynoglossus semilaevis]